MAAVTATPVGAFIGPDGKQPLVQGPDPVMITEYFTMPGGSAADTIAITPQFIGNIRGYECSFVAFSNLTLTATSVNATVTLTLGAAAAAGTYLFRIFGW